MTLDRVLTILGIIGGLSTISLWISKAREADLTQNITLKYVVEDVGRLRAELSEMRSQNNEGFKRVGGRIGNLKTVMYRFINQYNDPKKRDLNFEYVNFKELED